MAAQINRLTCENTTRPQVDIDHLINNDNNNNNVNTYNFDFSQMDIEPNELGDQFTVLNLNDIQQQFFEQDDEDRDYREYREDRYEEYREDDYYRNQEEDREEYYGNQDDDREELEDISAAEDQEDQEGEQEAQHYSNSGWYNVQTRMFHIGEMDGTQFVPYMEDVRNIEYFGQNVEEAEVVEDLDDEEAEIDDDSEEDEDMYDIMVRLEDENQDLRQQLEIARNQSRIVFPDGHHIGFETQNDVRYLYVYNNNNNNDNRPLTLDELQCDEPSEQDDSNAMDLS